MNCGAKFSLLALFLIGLPTQIIGHSWIACTDYAVKNGGDWDPKACRGFPREGAKYTPKNNFGSDTGYDTRPGSGSKPCKSDISDSSYSSEYPKAVYFPGQQVVLAHPMKNHGADTCTNIYIPDHGNFVYRGRPGADTHRNLDFYKRQKVADLGVSLSGSANTSPSKYPKPGFQNAPNFCKNTDRAIGTYSFNVPFNMKTGNYTFVWVWQFNSANDVYSTCFDVEVVRSKAARDTKLRGRGVGQLTVACGGKTSSNKPGSKAGCSSGGNRPTRPQFPTRRPVQPQFPTRRPVQPQFPTRRPVRPQFPARRPTRPTEQPYIPDLRPVTRVSQEIPGYGQNNKAGKKIDNVDFELLYYRCRNTAVSSRAPVYLLAAILVFQIIFNL